MTFLKLIDCSCGMCVCVSFATSYFFLTKKSLDFPRKQLVCSGVNFLLLPLYQTSSYCWNFIGFHWCQNLWCLVFSMLVLPWFLTRFLIRFWLTSSCFFVWEKKKQVLPQVAVRFGLSNPTGALTADPGCQTLEPTKWQREFPDAGRQEALIPTWKVDNATPVSLGLSWLPYCSPPNLGVALKSTFTTGVFFMYATLNL